MLNLTLTNVIAAENQYDNYAFNHENLHEGPSVIFNLSEENNYSDSVNLKSNNGVTTVKCTLSSYTAGVPNLYEIIIHWSGTNLVKELAADKLYINTGNLLDPESYHKDGFYINGLSAANGYRVVGTCLIPSDRKRVHVSSKVLRAYFYNRDIWLRLGELNGFVDL